MYKVLLCWRYLRTRYIALASIVSVTLGVATLIVVNSVLQKQGGFGSDSNEATLIDYEGRINSLPLMEKDELADKILDKIKELKAEQASMPRRSKTPPGDEKKKEDGEDQSVES